MQKDEVMHILIEVMGYSRDAIELLFLNEIHIESVDDAINAL